jgi:hypothetical protein
VAVHVKTAKKNKKQKKILSFAESQDGWHSAKMESCSQEFQLCREPARLALGKGRQRKALPRAVQVDSRQRFFKKKIKKSLPRAWVVDSRQRYFKKHKPFWPRAGQPSSRERRRQL